jgi:hypothetical protein
MRKQKRNKILGLTISIVTVLIISSKLYSTQALPICYGDPNRPEGWEVKWYKCSNDMCIGDHVEDDNRLCMRVFKP